MSGRQRESEGNTVPPEDAGEIAANLPMNEAAKATLTVRIWNHLKLVNWRNVRRRTRRFAANISIAVLLTSGGWAYGVYCGVVESYHFIRNEGTEYSNWMIENAVRLRGASADLAFLQYDISVIEADTLDKELISKWIDDNTPLAEEMIARHRTEDENEKRTARKNK
jgi:hypothetical protein